MASPLSNEWTDYGASSGMSGVFELALPVGGADHVLGAWQAPVTVVEYGDFECPNCKQAAPAVKLLLQRFGGQARFVYRHFPLEGIHPHALHAALAAETAAAQGRFWPMHDLLFENQRQLEPAALRRHAQRLELDMARYDAEMASGLHLRRVREHLESGERSGVRGTPCFFVNGRIEDVSFGMRRLFDAVEAALGK
jgi:protein-disulfide isomerase